MCKRLALVAPLVSLAILVLMPLAASAAKPPSPPPPSPGTGKILLGNGSDEIRVLDLDSGTQTVVVSTATSPQFYYLLDAIWSHGDDAQGRRWILFRAWLSGTTHPSEVWAVKEDGTDLHPVIAWNYWGAIYGPQCVALSRDDGFLAFSIYFSNTEPTHLYVQPFDAENGVLAPGSTPSEIASVTNRVWDILAATWSPDGQSMALQVYETQSGAYPDIWLVGPDPQTGPWGKFINLTNTPNAYEFRPDWSEATAASPEGRIAFELWESATGGYRGLAYMDPAGHVTMVPTGDGWQGSLHPSWSPGAAKIAVRAYQKGNGADIFTVNPDGTGWTNVTNTKRVNENKPAWRP